LSFNSITQKDVLYKNFREAFTHRTDKSFVYTAHEVVFPQMPLGTKENHDRLQTK